MFLRKIFLSLSAVGALTLVGCAHELMRGSVAMKVSDSEAHVCMEDAKLGEKVTLFKNVCTGPKGGSRSGLGDSRNCEKVKLGQGIVTEILNHHYSVVKFDSGVPFEEGTFVEKR